MKKLSKAVGGLLATAVALLGVIVASPAAQAATTCPSSHVCLYYSANETGSYYAFTASVPDLSSAKFTSAGAGQGKAVRNNAHSVMNNTTQKVTVYYSTNYGGTSQSFAASSGGNLNSSLVNNEASVKIATTAPASTTTSKSSTTSTPASTACSSGYVCLYYSANETGPSIAYNASVSTISGNFKGSSYAVRNNAHSVTNNTAYSVKIWTSPNYTGSSQTFAAHTSGNLVSPVLNNEASVQINPTSTTTKTSTTTTSTGAKTPAGAVAIAQKELALWNTGAMKPAGIKQPATWQNDGKKLNHVWANTGSTGPGKYTSGRMENWCADFAHWVYTQDGNSAAKYISPSVSTIIANAKAGDGGMKWHPAGDGYQPKPGDLEIENSGGHVTIYVGSNQVIGGNQGSNDDALSKVSQKAVSSHYGYVQMPAQ